MTATGKIFDLGQCIARLVTMGGVTKRVLRMYQRLQPRFWALLALEAGPALRIAEADKIMKPGAAALGTPSYALRTWLRWLRIWACMSLLAVKAAEAMRARILWPVCH